MNRKSRQAVWELLQRRRALRMSDETHLRYLEASRIDGAGVNLQGAVLCGHDEQPLGALVGVLLEPKARRLHYFVVDNGDRCQFLVPPGAIQLDEHRRALRIVASDQSVSWKEFVPGAFPQFTVNDVVEAMFSGTDTADTR